MTSPPARESPIRRRVGIFGGTFDPPHVGHVAAATEVADELDLDEVLWIPARRSPLKPDEPLTPAPLRLAMVEAAARSDPRFRVSTIELDRAGPSYTVDTLRTLRAGGDCAGAELFLIIGVDQYRAFDEWRSPDEIRRLATLAIMDRGGEGLAEPDGSVRRVPVSRIDVSATDVRRAVLDGTPWEHLVPEGVARLIRDGALYGGGDA